MLKTLLAIAVFTASSVAFCASPNLMPSQVGAEIKFIANAQSTVPNDLATVIVSAHAESVDLKDAQEKVNSLMTKAQGELKNVPGKTEFSNLSYSVRPIYGEKSVGNPSVLNWEAIQKVRITTKDLEIVPTLAQVAQANGLAITSVIYSLTNEALASVNEQLIGEVIKNVNKKASDIAQAMNLPFNLYRLEKIDFDESHGPVGPLLLAARATRADGENSQLPTFDPGTTEVQKTAQVTLKVRMTPESEKVSP